MCAGEKFGNRYRFTGREFEEEMGVYYYRARAYSPMIGRFLQRDPIGYEDGMNLYSYVKNNSVNKTDPKGLKTKDECFEDFQVCIEACNIINEGCEPDPDGIDRCQALCIQATQDCLTFADDNNDLGPDFNLAPNPNEPPLPPLNPNKPLNPNMPANPPIVISPPMTPSMPPIIIQSPTIINPSVNPLMGGMSGSDVMNVRGASNE